MNTEQNKAELQFLHDAVLIAKEARRTALQEIGQGKRVSNFMELRQLDMDIEICENELRRSA